MVLPRFYALLKGKILGGAKSVRFLGGVSAKSPADYLDEKVTHVGMRDSSWQPSIRM